MSSDLRVREAMEHALGPARRNIEQAVLAARVSSTPQQFLYPRATQRHASWACDYAAAGDLDATFAALLDIEALVAELVVRNS